jgi:2-dehydropantoate 2-reductase
VTWHIIGAGAIGSLWADRLHRQGEAITLVLRSSEQVDAFNRNGQSFRVESPNKELSMVQCKATWAEDLSDTISHLLITTKAFDALDAINRVKNQLASDATIVFMINGYGVQQTIQETFPDHNILFASTTDGAFNLAPFHTVHTANGTTLIGSLYKKVDSKVSPLCGADWIDDIDSILWRKVAINCCINPVTAIHQCTNGEIFSTDERATVTTNLAEEIEQLERKMGVDRQTPLIEEVKSVAELTSKNRSSMLQDVAKGRRTEVEHINGAIVDLAKKYAVEVPCNQEMLNTIQSLTLAER